MLADEEIFVRDTERAELARIHAMEQGDARSENRRGMIGFCLIKQSSTIPIVCFYFKPI